MKAAVSLAVIAVIVVVLVGGAAFFIFQKPTVLQESPVKEISEGSHERELTATPQSPETQPIPTTKEEPSYEISFRQNPEIPSEKEMGQISDCSDKLYSAAPVDLAKIAEITPLGNLGPPGHTFPTEHAFFHITTGGTTTETIPLYSPGDIHISLITINYGSTQDPVDYTTWFALCKDVLGYYNHVKEISADLQKIVDENNCSFQGETKVTRCNIETLSPIKSGTLIGRVGRLQGNFDFGTIDLRKTLGFANPNRYGTRSLHIQCPFDYYDSPIKSKFYDLISRTDGTCGITAQDVPGTLKGNWFFGSSRADSGTDWDKYLAFVEDNEDPSTSVVSIGGYFTDAGKWEFKPKTSGLVNREFSHVTPGGNVYCYESESQSGRIVVQLVSEKQLKIEKQSGSCSESFTFNKPTLYDR